MSATRRAAASPFRTDPTRAARHQRDAGIERTRSITRGAAFASVAAVAVAGVYLSQAIPGHAASTGGATSGAAGAATPAGAPAPGSSYGTSYPTGAAPSAPAAAPTPAYSQAPVVSSGSS